MPEQIDPHLRRSAIEAAYSQAVGTAFQLFFTAGPHKKDEQERFARAMANAEKAFSFALQLGEAGA